MSRVWRITAVVICLAGVLGYPADAGASCIAPQLTVDGSSVERGQIIVIRGEHFGTACNDTGQPGPGLGAPQTAITVRMVQGEMSVPIVVVDADDDYRFIVKVAVPSVFTEGPASLTAPNVRLPVPVAISAAAASSQSSVPPTVLVGRDSTAPRVEPSDDSSNAPWIVAGVLVVGLVTAIVTSIVIRRRRPRSWIQEPLPQP